MPATACCAAIGRTRCEVCAAVRYNWDHHGGPTENLRPTSRRSVPTSIGLCGFGEGPQATWVARKHHRGVGWGVWSHSDGEVRESTGRNHHIDAFTMWFAGGGFKAGTVYGETDEFGFGPIENPVHVHDIHAAPNLASAGPGSSSPQRPLPRPKLPPNRRRPRARC